MARDIMPGGAGVNSGAQGNHDATAPLMAFLLLQHDSFFARLYSSEAVCLGLFRLLSPLMRQVIMSILWLPTSIKSKDLKVMLKLSPHAKHEELDAILQPISDLRILSRQPHRGLVDYQLRREFKGALRAGLTGGGTSKSFGVPYVPSSFAASENDMSVDDLVDHGNRTWEDLLKYMVASNSYASEVDDAIPHKDVLDLLVKCDLMQPAKSKKGEPRPGFQISSRGFQFLLEDRSVQIWQILMFYVGMRKTESGDQSDGVEILRLYFTLGSMQLGRAYTTQGFTKEQLRVLDRLMDYGLVARPDARGPGRPDKFYPTRLGTTLCSGFSSGDMSGHQGRRAGEGFIILETNYKVYAYTDNELEIAILNLFIDIRVRYPNLIVGKLDRDTVKKAMAAGIAATQIISYLTTHAHPQMHKNNPLLPVTVVDQLHLWDRERNRLKDDTAALFEFKKRVLFDEAVKYATQIGSLLYQSSSNHHIDGFLGLLVVQDYSKNPLKEYINNRRAEYALA